MAVGAEDFWGRPLPDGRPITSPEALSLSGVYAAVRLLAESISTLPLGIVQRQGDIRRRIQHPAADLLDTPNSCFTRQTLLEVLIAHIETDGEGFWEKVNEGGRCVALWPLAPHRVRPERVGAGMQFKIATNNGEVVAGPDRVAFFRNAVTSPDGVRGISPIRLLNKELAAAKAARDYGANFFENGATPSGTLSHPAALTDEAAERLRRQFKKRYSGAKNSGEPLLLEEGLSWAPVGTNPENSQLLETRQYSISDISRIWRIPPHMLADLSRSTFSNAESEMQSFATHSLRPRLARLEAQLDMALLSLEERRAGLGFSFNLDGLLRGSLLDRYKSYQLATASGILNANECRTFENREPYKGGEVYHSMPGAMPVNAPDAGQEETP